MRLINAIVFVILLVGNYSVISEAKRYDQSASSRSSASEADNETGLLRENSSPKEPNVDLDDSSNTEEQPENTSDMGSWYWEQVEKNQKYCAIATEFIKSTIPYLPNKGSNSKEDAIEITKDFEKYMANMLSKAVTNYNDYRDNHKKLRLQANEISDITLNNCRSAPVSFLSMVLTSASAKAKEQLIRNHEIDKFIEIAEKELDMKNFPAMRMLMQSIEAASKNIVKPKSSSKSSEKTESRKSKRRSFFSKRNHKSMNENGGVRVRQNQKKKHRRSFRLFKKRSS